MTQEERDKVITILETISYIKTDGEVRGWVADEITDVHDALIDLLKDDKVNAPRGRENLVSDTTGNAGNSKGDNDAT